MPWNVWALMPGDAEAFPAEALGLPGLAIGTPSEDGVEACEEEQLVRMGSGGLETTGLRGMWVERSGWSVSMM